VNDALERQLIAHEGLRTDLYKCTAGKWTIGIGHNIQDRGLTRDQCLLIFRDDVATVIGELVASFPWFEDLDPVRQAVLVDMAFNLGTRKLAKFGNTLAAVRRGDYRAASVHMLQSLWAEQVGRRSLTLATMMETGVNPFQVATPQADGDDGA
jgi:lysozyme